MLELDIVILLLQSWSSFVVNITNTIGVCVKNSSYPILGKMSLKRVFFQRGYMAKRVKLNWVRKRDNIKKNCILVG